MDDDIYLDYGIFFDLFAEYFLALLSTVNQGVGSFRCRLRTKFRRATW